MATADLSSITARIRHQYEIFPYPVRDPADEKKRLIVSGLDELAAVNQNCYRGRRDFRSGFRVLVAGGGTGDATIFLAEQLRQTDAQIVHLDLSEASLRIAKQRARHRGLYHRIRWKWASLLQLDPLDLGRFDYRIFYFDHRLLENRTASSMPCSCGSWLNVGKVPVASRSTFSMPSGVFPWWRDRKRS